MLMAYCKRDIIKCIKRVQVRAQINEKKVNQNNDPIGSLSQRAFIKFVCLLLLQSFGTREAGEMKKSLITIVNKQFASRQSLYLKDPKSDLFVILNEKIYPLHKGFLNQIGYFTSEDFKAEKVHMIDSSLDQKCFQMVISYYYGKQLQFSRNWALEKLLYVIRFLRIPTLQKKIVNDIKNNYDDYGFFLLLSISQKFKIKWLKEQCEQELILMGFQQLNYNRYDLLQVDKNTLEQIIKLHEILKVNQNIVGLRTSDLKRILTEYSKANNIPLEIDQMLTSCQTSSRISRVQQQEENEASPRKRNSTWNGNQLDDDEKQSTTLSGSKGTNNSCNILSNHHNVGGEEKKQQLNKLKLINSEIQQKNSKLIAQIKSVKDNIHNSIQVQSHETDIQGIDQRFKNFQKTCQEQQAKYLSLKSQMQKLSPTTRKNPINQVQSQRDLNVKIKSANKINETQVKTQKSGVSETTSTKLDKQMKIPQLRLDNDF